MGLSIEEVISEIRDQWVDINGIEGIGQGKVDDKDCILVFLARKRQRLKKPFHRNLRVSLSR